YFSDSRCLRFQLLKEISDTYLL
ncbi:hypothetical protein D027_4541B, partial [Vibrio parahaemolyticus 861]